MKYLLLAVTVVALAGCDVPTTPPSQSPPSQSEGQSSGQSSDPLLSPAQANRNFRQALARVEPVAEAQCRQRAPDLNCDFKIVVDARAGLPPNAFQTLDENGRPIIGFTTALIQDARNTDEIAFVMGHEAAHHIARHLVRQQQSAVGGAILGGLVAIGLGLDPDVGQQVGGTIGARVYSKDNELEADALGTIISKRAGYDPVRGAQFFARVPDPGDRFLGTHPPNAARIETVRRVNAGL